MEQSVDESYLLLVIITVVDVTLIIEPFFSVRHELNTINAFPYKQMFVVVFIISFANY